MFCTRCFNFCPFLFLFISYRRLSRPPFHQDRPCGVTRDLHVVIPSGEFQGCVFYDLEAPFDQLTDNPSSLESFCTWLLGWHFLRVFLWLLAVHLNFPLLFPSPIQGSELDSFFILHLHSCFGISAILMAQNMIDTLRLLKCQSVLDLSPELQTWIQTCLPAWPSLQDLQINQNWILGFFPSQFVATSSSFLGQKCSSQLWLSLAKPIANPISSTFKICPKSCYLYPHTATRVEVSIISARRQ